MKERLIPAALTISSTHPHRSTYSFFGHIIEIDQSDRQALVNKTFTSLDQVCCVGHGCLELSLIDFFVGKVRGGTDVFRIVLQVAQNCK